MDDAILISNHGFVRLLMVRYHVRIWFYLAEGKHAVCFWASYNVYLFNWGYRNILIGLCDM
jgi:hypothetical protein